MFAKSITDLTFRFAPQRVSRLRALAWLPVALTFLVCATSADAVKLGSNNISAAVVTGFCTPGNSWVQRATAPTSPRYQVPSAGRITSWTTSAATPSTAALKIWRPTSNPAQFVPVAQSATQIVPGTSRLATFTTSIAVRKGDVIGVAAITGQLRCLYATSSKTGDIAARVLGDPTFGTQTFTTYENTARLNLSVALTTCLVPNLVGKTLTAARSTLTNAHCALGTVTRKSSPRRPGIVLSQTPRAGKYLPIGSKVSVVVSKP